jgi:hypothetical protein
MIAGLKIGLRYGHSRVAASLPRPVGLPVFPGQWQSTGLLSLRPSARGMLSQAASLSSRDPDEKALTAISTADTFALVSHDIISELRILEDYPLIAGLG